MALVICDMSISLDGYVTGPNDSRENPFGDGAGMLHDWIFDAATDDDRAIVQELLDGTPLFGMLDSSITLERTQALATPAATHLGFRVVR